MSDNNTDANDKTDVQVDNESDAKGSETSNTNKNEEKTLTQKEVDAIIKSRIAENSAKVKRDLEKSYEGKLVLTEAELEQRLKDYATTAIAEHVRSETLKVNRANYKSKGLSETQLDAIEKQLDKPENYAKVADELFGALLTKNPPIIQSGNTNTKTSDTTDVDDLIGKSLESFRNRK